MLPQQVDELVGIAHTFLLTCLSRCLLSLVRLPPSRKRSPCLLSLAATPPTKRSPCLLSLAGLPPMMKELLEGSEVAIHVIRGCGRGRAVSYRQQSCCSLFLSQMASYFSFDNYCSPAWAAAPILLLSRISGMQYDHTPDFHRDLQTQEHALPRSASLIIYQENVSYQALESSVQAIQAVLPI